MNRCWGFFVFCKRWKFENILKWKLIIYSTILFNQETLLQDHWLNAIFFLNIFTFSTIYFHHLIRKKRLYTVLWFDRAAGLSSDKGPNELVNTRIPEQAIFLFFHFCAFFKFAVVLIFVIFIPSPVYFEK